jgi:hypothetical protein
MIWRTAKGVIPHSFLFPGQAMNVRRYCKEIRKMNVKVAQQ